MKTDSIISKDHNELYVLQNYDFGGGVTGILKKNTLTLEKTNLKEDGRMEDYQSKKSPAYEISEIKNLVIGKNIKYIGKNAFSGKYIENLILGEDVEIIGEGAFRSCNLKRVVIPDSVLAIKRSAFSCNRIVDLKLGIKVLDIEAWAFDNNDIERVIVEDNVKYIGIEAFANNNISYLALGKSIELIGLNAFTSNNLSYIKFPDKSVEICEAAFYGNPITKIDIGNNVEIKSYTPEELIEIDTFGNNIGFKEIYSKENHKKGSYVWNTLNEIWSKNF